MRVSLLINRANYTVLAVKMPVYGHEKTAGKKAPAVSAADQKLLARDNVEPTAVTSGAVEAEVRQKKKG